MAVNGVTELMYARIAGRLCGCEGVCACGHPAAGVCADIGRRTVVLD